MFPVFHYHTTELNLVLNFFLMDLSLLYSFLRSRINGAKNTNMSQLFILEGKWPFKMVVLISWLNTFSFFDVLVGHGGDKPHPADPGVHVHVSRHHQREGEGGPEDVLCEHGNVKVPFPEQPGFLKSIFVLARRVCF